MTGCKTCTQYNHNPNSYTPWLYSTIIQIHLQIQLYKIHIIGCRQVEKNMFRKS